VPQDFDQRWRDWLRLNLQRGCDRAELHRLLLEAGFGPDTVVSEFARASVAMAGGGAGSVPEGAPDPARIPRLARHPSRLLELYTAEGFLAERDCAAVIAAMQSGLRQSTISTPDEPDKYFRVSQTCDLEPGHPIAGPIDARICAAMRIPPEQSEVMQAQLYEVGGEFKAHTDYFERHELPRFSTDKLGQRTWTFMIYLNEPEDGGETAFVSAGIVVRPKTGLAVIWNNLRPDGTPNPATLHHGMPVKAGRKAIITKWFREPRKT
jgi:prolyl 4-hydroxylase